MSTRVRPVMLAGAMIAAAFAGGARAEVVRQWDTGFAIRHVVEAPVRADRAYAALGEVGRWWSSAHTYSGDAPKALTLEMKPGGCFCEALAGGGVAHGTVVLAWPAQGMLRLDAALGPLQDQGVSGALTFTVKPKGTGASEVVLTYSVSGGPPGLAQAFAAPVDGVMGEALSRYGRYLRTGTPD